MWELDFEKIWAPKNWCFWTVVLEKTLESPKDCKEIQPVHSKGDQPWDFFGRNDAKAETPVLWPPHVKSWLIGKNSDAGRDWGQEEKGTTGYEMTGWHHRLDGCEFQWTPGDGDGQRGLAWWTGRLMIHGVAKSWTRLRDWTELSTYGFTLWPRNPPLKNLQVCLLVYKNTKLLTVALFMIAKYWVLSNIQNTGSYWNIY